jgi:hypothetical protein
VLANTSPAAVYVTTSAPVISWTRPRTDRLSAKSLRLTARAAPASCATTRPSRVRRMSDWETNAAMDVVMTATSTIGITIR